MSVRPSVACFCTDIGESMYIVWAAVCHENGQMKTLHICSLTRKKFGTGNMHEI
jgi:hypothetical protein